MITDYFKVSDKFDPIPYRVQTKSLSILFSMCRLAFLNKLASLGPVKWYLQGISSHPWGNSLEYLFVPVTVHEIVPRHINR